MKRLPAAIVALMLESSHMLETSHVWAVIRIAFMTRLDALGQAEIECMV